MRISILYLVCTHLAFAEGTLLKTLSKDGFPARVNVVVRDSDGKLVDNANVRFSFTYINRETPNLVYTKTNSDGVATGEERTNNQVIISISKLGYYRTSYKYHVWKGSEGYETGRWEPWDTTIDLTLYKEKKKIKRDTNTCVIGDLDPWRVYCFSFLTNKVVPLEDIEDNEYDLLFSTHGSYYSNDITYHDDWVSVESFSFPRISEGVLKRGKNPYSVFRYDYEAPDDGYVSNIEYRAEQKDGTYYQYKRYPQNTEYLIFRISRQENCENRKFYYGIIDSWNISKNWATGKLQFYIRYRINSNADDRNIEYY